MNPLLLRIQKSLNQRLLVILMISKDRAFTPMLP